MSELATVSFPFLCSRTSYLEYEDLGTFYRACQLKIVETNSVLEAIVESLRKYILCDSLSETDRDLLFGGKPVEILENTISTNTCLLYTSDAADE